MKTKFYFTLEKLLILGLLDPELDPDPHSSKSLDPDPHVMNADPKHCRYVTCLYHLEYPTDSVKRPFSNEIGLFVKLT
jgi:hypothetical protein